MLIAIGSFLLRLVLFFLVANLKIDVTVVDPATFLMTLRRNPDLDLALKLG
jgi:hypothetical protein